MSGLEIAGAALAVPGAIDVIVRGGEAVYHKIETFKTVDKAVNRYSSVQRSSLLLTLTTVAVSASWYLTSNKGRYSSDLKLSKVPRETERYLLLLRTNSIGH